MKSSRPRAAVATANVLVSVSRISVAGATDYDDLIQKRDAEIQQPAKREGTIESCEEMQAVINQYQEAAKTFRQAEQNIRDIRFGVG